MEEDKCIKLYNGQLMPYLGLGTWHHGDQGEMTSAIEFSLDNGFRNIDCAYCYGNEKKVGEIFNKLIGPDKKLKRSEVFVTGKLWNTDHAKERVEEACRSSLADLKLSYFDLYIIHWPTGLVPGKGNVPRDEETGEVLFSGITIEETWKALEKLVDLGLTKSIGLSNFNSRQINQIFQICRIRPAVLQVECNPRFNNESLRKFCDLHSITLVGFSPFGSPDLPWGEKMPHILADPTLKEIATRLGKSPAQVVLRWQIQRGVGIIPKSVINAELEDNLGIFGWELNSADMELVNGLNTGVRKIVPLITMPDGTQKIRDATDSNFPFGFVEGEEE